MVCGWLRYPCGSLVCVRSITSLVSVTYVGAPTSTFGAIFPAAALTRLGTAFRRLSPSFTMRLLGQIGTAHYFARSMDNRSHYRLAAVSRTITSSNRGGVLLYASAAYTAPSRVD